MKTVKLKIKNEIEITKLLKIYNSVVRYSFNRFQQNLTQKQIRLKVKQKFKGNSWILICAIKDGLSLFKKHKQKKIIFGGMNNLKKYMKNLITKDEYKENKLRPILIQGEQLHKGNRLFNFDLVNDKVVFKEFKKNHIQIQLPKLRNNLKKQFLKLQELIQNKQITVTVSLNNEYISFTYDQKLINLKQKFKNLKSNRVLGIDLNPNNIGLSILEFNKNDEFKVLHKEVINLFQLNKISGKSSSDLKSKYLNNKRNYELIQVCYYINLLINTWKCSKLCIEDLNIKANNQCKGKYRNRICNNCWNRGLIVNKLKMLAGVYNYQFVQVNPVYSSFIGNILYGNENTPDMVASSIEVARRGYKKYTKGWFYPTLNVEHLNEQWKQTLNGVQSWKEAFNKFKNLNLKYRFQLLDLIKNAVFSKKYKQKNVSLYCF